MRAYPLPLAHTKPIDRHCAACAGPLDTFALGCRVYGERCFVCSPSCRWTLYRVWQPRMPRKRVFSLARLLSRAAMLIVSLGL